MGYSPWGYKESDMTEQITLSLSCQLSHLQNVSRDYHPRGSQRRCRKLETVYWPHILLAPQALTPLGL